MQPDVAEDFVEFPRPILVHLLIGNSLIERRAYLPTRRAERFVVSPRLFSRSLLVSSVASRGQAIDRQIEQGDMHFSGRLGAWRRWRSTGTCGASLVIFLCRLSRQLVRHFAALVEFSISFGPMSF